ncbi:MULTISPECIES: TetR/AcrR family transcriptional regulator [Streptomyces]|uniref:TetR/AcrR family transcriptional regulator n=1 Tax=Streptomyces tsukubensis (strain DSM 42081 / NBRC 108919 / NRRL 18488 / 9993) TaxID=1114943 RepID=I2MUW5_STRT9|nr:MULTISPECIES: TetR/AcrR family transcriptional regulator [Streptomyces]AZK93054.1 TetR family transcriptional regulator [Streptomyces tsukubensis]EIF88562.1 TetR family transcriptional regulator [Streptomyces tsukubensis NRRL18488]MYS64227.1 TetR family transcriptional regulator [Streptomyces sp. SID5473]QKM70782.1 TetR/AcrR family transcriptional regulator [Streptomyces tsukubensis NRRL18488]TAI41100.1 TetR/AcrR family transcriptional regulator [Streptomyces tsukubensis]
MGDADPGTPRERYRAQVRAEIKERAWEQIAAAGASALSLNAIAKQLGMSGPALYRYFAGRDDLITELVRDAYRSLADTVRTAAAAGAGLAALAHTLRDWALADPQRYLLVYGTPVPGYHAPEDITGISSEIMAVLLDACAALAPAGPPTPFDSHLADHRNWAGAHPAPPAALHLALAFWTRVHGLLSLELSGHFAGMDFEPALFFAAEVDALTARGA